MSEVQLVEFGYDDPDGCRVLYRVEMTMESIAKVLETMDRLAG